MSKKLFHNENQEVSGEISICGSKSESNRLLVLNALFGNPISLKNLSNSEDTQLLQKALESNTTTLDIHHAGTAMRFLTAYLSTQVGKEFTLTGSERMKQRPIGILVEALRSIDAEISYVEKEGFPPLKIKGRKLEKDFVQLNADVSSQFITALMLIGSRLPNGLRIQLNGKITSLPYVEMSLHILNQLGIKAEKSKNEIQIHPVENLKKQEFTVESDWSSASYFYSVAALAKKAEIKIHSFKENSLQGDSKLVEIYNKYFGVETRFEQNQISLKKNENFNSEDSGQYLELNLNDTPDIAQTLAVTCAGLKIKCKFTGLETLKVKETDRLIALQNELFKVGAIAEITASTLEIVDFISPQKNPVIQTYNDHRMAMSFAPLAILHPIEIENPEVVEKSYPDFWKDMGRIGIQ